MPRNVPWPAIDAIRAAIVVPTYKQPGLLPEALHSSLAQDTDFAFCVVIVNDGCPFEETDWVCREAAAAHPGRVFYLNRRNGGLSAARNTGIAFALDAFPELEAVYFLDSDNKLHTFLLQRLYNALRFAGPEIGWIYTDIDKFGFDEFCDLSGHYSPLEHLFRNVSEAGSMVARRMLDAGVRFDEAMRHGYEDWEFWLQGLERGFRGMHVPCAGFRYRRRGESMLRDAARRHDEIMNYIQTKHPRLFRVPEIVRLETTCAQRYALVTPEDGAVRCLTSPHGPLEALTTSGFVRRLLRALERPSYDRCPGLIILIPLALIELLDRQKLLSGMLWMLERAAAQAAVVTCRISISGSPDTSFSYEMQSLSIHSQATLLPSAEADIVALQTSLLLDPAGPSSARSYRDPRQASHHVDLALRLALPESEPAQPQAQAIKGLEKLCNALEDARKQHEASGWSAAQFDRHRAGVQPPGEVYRVTHRLPSVLPVERAAGQRSVALLVGRAEGSRSLATVVHFATGFRRDGWSPHLVACGEGPFSWTQGESEMFESIIFLPFPFLSLTRNAKATNAYLGTVVPLMTDGDAEYALGTLAAFDRVAIFDWPPAYAVIGELRRIGVEIWAILGRGAAPGQEDISPFDSVNACAAFENACDVIVALDKSTENLCRGLGLPVTKLFRSADYQRPI